MADIIRKNSKFDREITIAWLEKILNQNKIYNLAARKEYIDNYLSGDDLEADLLCVYRKK